MNNIIPNFPLQPQLINPPILQNEGNPVAAPRIDAAVDRSFTCFNPFAKIRKMAREAFAKRIISCEMDGEDKRRFDGILMRFPTKQERQDFVIQSKKLINLRMGSRYRLSILEAVAKVPQEERKDLIKQAKRLAKSNNKSDFNKAVIESLAKLPLNERKSFVDIALRLIVSVEQNMEESLILRDLANIPSHEREQVCDQITRLVTPETDKITKNILLKEIVKIPPQRRQRAVDQALKLILPAMRDSDKVIILQAVSHEREMQAVDQALRLMPPYMNAQERIGVLIEIASVPLDERERFVDLVPQLIPPFVDILDLRLMIRTIAGIPAQEREDVIRQALRVIDPRMQARTQRHYIEELGNMDENERENYVQERLQPAAHVAPVRVAPPVQNLAMDVHAENRDQKLKDSLESLRAHQGEKSQEEIEAAVESFVDYISQSPMSDREKELAMKALYEDRKPDEYFGPLFDSVNNFTVQGLEITGAELIGRLWIFASSLNEPESENTKQGMILGLNRSFDEAGKRVCNQGKTQRLVVASLQGRLAGVEIDQVDAPVSTETMVKLFFLPQQRQAIDTREALLAEAERFLADGNDRVNREEFLEAMNRHANLMGF